MILWYFVAQFDFQSISISAGSDPFAFRRCKSIIYICEHQQEQQFWRDNLNIRGKKSKSHSNRIWMPTFRCGRTTHIIRNNVQNKVITRHNKRLGVGACPGAVPCTVPTRLVSSCFLAVRWWAALAALTSFSTFSKFVFCLRMRRLWSFFPQRRPKANNIAYFAAEADVGSDADADGDNHWHAPHTRPPTHTQAHTYTYTLSHPLTYRTSKLSVHVASGALEDGSVVGEDPSGSSVDDAEQARNKFGTVSHVIGFVSFIVYRFNCLHGWQATRWAASSGLWRFVAACLGSAFVLYSLVSFVFVLFNIWFFFFMSHTHWYGNGIRVGCNSICSKLSYNWAEFCTSLCLLNWQRISWQRIRFKIVLQL